MAKGTGSETIIAHGVRLEGDLVAEGDLIIEGEVHGNVKTQGDLRIGEQALVEADIEAGNALVSGTIHGNILVRGKLELLPSSSLTGDVTTEVFVVGPGACVNGMIRMGAEAVVVPKGKKRTESVEE
ncbi:MAG: polymer-forming cytoskeletal protein [Patescibacteria group bacterium]|jgi:cytoskeletal protein CcmA (bactofilin family)